jgi:hypothetical protein
VFEKIIHFPYTSFYLLKKSYSSLIQSEQFVRNMSRGQVCRILKDRAVAALGGSKYLALP